MEKREFVKEINRLFDYANVSSYLDYAKEENGEEYVSGQYDGYEKKICVTADSNYGIMLDVFKRTLFGNEYEKAKENAKRLVDAEYIIECLLDVFGSEDLYEKISETVGNDEMLKSFGIIPEPKYKIVEVEVTKTMTQRVKVAIPVEDSDYDAKDIVEEDECELDWDDYNYDIDSEVNYEIYGSNGREYKASQVSSDVWNYDEIQED